MRVLLRRCAFLVLLASLAGSAGAQEVFSEEVYHWAMAPLLGTGVYDFDSDQTIYVFEYTPRWTWREGAPYDASPRRPGIDVLVPATLGLRSFDLGDLPGTLDPGNVSTLSVVPGVYVTWPVNERLSLLGIANLGIGTRLDGGEAALIHRLGLRARMSFWSDDVRWNLVAALEHVGYNTNQDRRDALMPLSLGVEVEVPIPAWQYHGGAMRVVGHVTGSHYLDELTFAEIEEAGSAISKDLEVGVALLPATRFKLWRLSWERIGIAYRRGEGERDSTFEGIRLYFRSLFEQ